MSVTPLATARERLQGFCSVGTRKHTENYQVALADYTAAVRQDERAALRQRIEGIEWHEPEWGFRNEVLASLAEAP